MTNPHPHPEQQYLDLLRTLLAAPERPDRTGTGTRSIFGHQMTFDLADGFPLLTTKKLPFRVIALELLWMLSGSTNVRDLQKDGVTIWDEWADEHGELGPVYGKQMRAWRGAVEMVHVTFESIVNGDDMVVDYDAIDQIANVLQGLRDDPYGRRHVMTLWNPADLPDMALPPCHGIVIQFYVESDGRLSLFMHQRSADAFLGLPFNIASYALLLRMFASALSRPVGRFIWSGGDVHLYSNHVDQAVLQITRAPRRFPSLTTRLPSLGHGLRELRNWQLGDFTLRGYEPWPHIPGDVSV